MNINKGHVIEDFYREKHQVKSQQDLYAVYELSERQSIEKHARQFGMPGDTQADPFVDWMVKRGICPHAIVTSTSKYWFETCVLLDGEMGLTLPDPKLSVGETPAIFFQALSIVRAERSKVKEEEQARKNAQNNRD